MSDDSLRTTLQQRRLVEDALLEAVRPIAVQIGLPQLVDRLTPAIAAAMVELVPWPREALSAEVHQPVSASPPPEVESAPEGDTVSLVKRLFHAAPLTA